MAEDPTDDPASVRRPRRARRRPDPLDPEGAIGVRLRALYAAAEAEPIPADLIELLERLDAAEGRDGA